MKKIIGICLLFCSLFQSACAQVKPPFYEDIQRFKRQDSAQFPAAGQILFVGSSSFTNWKDVANYFPGYSIINRGFGGSTLPDVIRFADDIIFPYQPKQIVIYCGENDLASSEKITGEEVFERFQKLYQLIRKSMPEVPVAFISLKPSPSREQLWPKMIVANQRIQTLLGKEKNAAFINVWPAMMNAEGKAMPDIFIEDRLHMNAKGYRIWANTIQPFLVH